MDDDDYTALAAILRPAPAGCWVVAHRRLAGVDDLYTAAAAIRQQAPLRPAAGWWCTGGLLAWTTSTLHGPPSGSRLRPAAGWWRTGLRDSAIRRRTSCWLLGWNLCATCRR